MKSILAVIFVVAVCNAQQQNSTIPKVDLDAFVLDQLNRLLFVGNNSAHQCVMPSNSSWESAEEYEQAYQTWTTYVNCTAQNNPKAVEKAAKAFNVTAEDVTSGALSLVTDILLNGCSLNQLVVDFADRLYNDGNITEQVWQETHAALDPPDARQAAESFDDDNRRDICYVGAFIYGAIEDSFNQYGCFSQESKMTALRVVEVLGNELRCEEIFNADNSV